MKSIQNQYIDLQEGKMSQTNFMRNMRMSLPQYITNVTSFGDTVKILKNKGILSEASFFNSDTDEMDYDPKQRSQKQMNYDSNEVEIGDIVSYTGSDKKYGEKILKKGTKGKILANVGGEFTVDFDTLGINALVGISDLTSNNESLKEAKDEKGKWTNADGKSMYGQFDEINIVNSQELLIGIDYEMVKNCDLSKEKATKIAIKKIKQVPNYYTMAGLAGVEGTKPEYIGGKSANPEAHQMQYLDKNMGNVVDKKRGMQSVKDVEKFKKDSTTGGETNKVVKGVETTSFIAKTVRGVQKMNATGEKVKIIKLKEELNYSQSNLKLTPEETAKIKRVLPDAEFEWDEDDRKQVVYSNKPEREIRNIVNQATGQAPVPSNTVRPGIGDAIQNKITKEALIKMIREELDEITGAYGGDAMSAEDGSSYM